MVDLLRRTKSLRSPNGKTDAIDSEQPNILDFDFKGTLVSDIEHGSKRNLKVGGKIWACSGHLLNQPTSGQAIDVDHDYSPVYSHNTRSSQFPGSISNPRDSEIGIAITTPYEDSHFAISEDEQSYEAGKATSFDWPTFVRPTSIDHHWDSPRDQGKSKWSIITGLLRKKPMSIASPLDRSLSKSSRDLFHRRPIHHQPRDSGIPTPLMFQEGLYTYRCPPEWDYCFQQSPEARKSLSNSRTNGHQAASHVPSRKHSWRRTLSRKKSKFSERSYKIQTASVYPLSQTGSHGLEHPLDFDIVQDDAPPSSNTSGSSFLEVEIPTIKMERYSVMFSSLLQPAQPQPPSLLTRRQGPRAELRLEKRL